MSSKITSNFQKSYPIIEIRKRKTFFQNAMYDLLVEAYKRSHGLEKKDESVFSEIWVVIIYNSISIYKHSCALAERKTKEKKKIYWIIIYYLLLEVYKHSHALVWRERGRCFSEVRYLIYNIMCIKTRKSRKIEVQVKERSSEL